MVKRFEVWNIELSPTVGHEINKLRPCVVISPDEANKHLKTVIIVPLTSKTRHYPTRVKCMFKGRQGELAIDQIRSVDVHRLQNKLGILQEETCRLLCQTLNDTFRF